MQVDSSNSPRACSSDLIPKLAAPFTSELILTSLKHLDNRTIGDLKSEVPITFGNAMGHLYEYMVYERAKQISSGPELEFVVKKRYDVPFAKMKAPALGQNGLLYNGLGEIVARGNGIDIAEFDLLAKCANGRMIFAEVVGSGLNLKGFEEEVKLKRRVLKMLTGREEEFLLVTPADLVTRKLVRTLESNQLNHYVKIQDVSEFVRRTSLTRGGTDRGWNPDKSAKFAFVDELQGMKFDYPKLVAQTRSLVASSIRSGVNPDELVGGLKDSVLSGVLLGVLDRDAIRQLLSRWKWSVKGIEIPSHQFALTFTKCVLGLSIPDLRPNVYLRSAKRRVYMRFSPISKDTFRLERLIRRWHTLMFDLIDTERDILTANDVSQVLSACSRDSIFRTGTLKQMSKREVIKAMGLDPAMLDKSREPAL